MAKATSRASNKSIVKAAGSVVDTPLNIVTDIQVTTADVMAIGMVRIEQRLEEQVKQFGAELRTAEKTVSTLEERLAKSRRDRVEEYFADAKKALEHGFKLAGMSVTVQVQSGEAGSDRLKWNGSILVANCYNACRTVEFVANNEQQQLLKDRDAAVADVSEIRNRFVEAKANLAKLPSLERKYRANLAEAQLNKSVEGKELLAAMQDQTAGDLTRLCGPK